MLKDKREDGLDDTEGGSGRDGITVQITVDGDGDDADQTRIEVPPTSTRKEQVVDEDKSIRSGAKTGRSKRKRPANRLVGCAPISADYLRVGFFVLML